MTSDIVRNFFLGFVKIHLLYHATDAPIFGLEMLRELARHGYTLSPGTLYPILHRLETQGYLVSEQRVVSGRRRKYYRTTPQGQAVLRQALRAARELLSEIELTEVKS